MNKEILNTINQEFINNNLDCDIAIILLKGSSSNKVEAREIIEQIESKKKCKLKLPTWYQTTNIYYPNKLNIEQSSSETTAKYKSELFQGKSIIDITGGFGVDSYYFTGSFEQVTYCEVDEHLSQIVKHNYQQLNITNVKILNVDGILYLRKQPQAYDWIYIDPSRRHDSKGKVFYLKDCLPNVPEHLSLLFKYTDNILLKASPMLDISVGISELEHVKTVHIVAVNNDVKELLFHLEKGFEGDVSVKTINFAKRGTQTFEYYLNEEKAANPFYSNALNYLYEPNGAILKAGAFKLISTKLNLNKLHKHSHLYTSSKPVVFPGRRFKIEKVLPYKPKGLNKLLKSKKANVAVRNFPGTVNQIRKKFKIKDGGELYVFFTTNVEGEKIVITTTKA